MNTRIKTIIYTFRLLSIILCIVQNTHGQTVTHGPYSFPETSLKYLTPFSTAQQMIIKDLGVYKVEKISYNYSDQPPYNKTIYLFNDSGKLVQEKTMTVWKRSPWSGFKEKQNSDTRYSYDANGRLIVKDMQGRRSHFYDSLSYSKTGQINSYYSFIQYDFGNKHNRRKRIMHNWNKKGVIGNYTVFKDAAAGNTTYVTINKENRIIKVISGNRSDSISFEVDTAKNKIEKYWFKTSPDSTYRLGKVSRFHNDLLISDTLFFRNTHSIYSKKYYYSTDNQLIRTEGYASYGVFADLYIYDWNGLLIRRIISSDGVTSTNEYRYFYR